MKKLMIGIGIAAVLVIGTAGAFASGAVQKIGKLIQEQFAEPAPYAIAELPDVQSENQQRREVIAQRLSQQENAETMSLYDQMIQALEATVENPNTYNDIIYNYEYLKQVYHMEPDEMDYIANLIIQGYDPMTVMDICYFWQDTNEEISIIEQIYEYKYLRGMTWIENAFNCVTNDKCGVLTEEDVENYAKQGVTLDDISAANKLCRKGVLTIQEILEQHQAGKTFAEIAAYVNGISLEQLPVQAIAPAAVQTVSDANAGEIKQEASEEPIPLEDVILAGQLSTITQKPLADYYEMALEDQNLEEIAAEQERAFCRSIVSELRAKGIYKDLTREESEFYDAKGENENV